MINLSLSKLTGPSGASGWSQVFEFRNELYLLVSSDFPYPEIASKIEEEYFGHPELKPFNAIRIAVEKASKEVPDTRIGVEIAAVSFKDGVTYSAAIGGAQVLIERGGATATILSSKPGEVASASGFPKAGDKIIVGTKDFFEKVPQDLIKRDLRVETIEGVDMGKVGVMIAGFSEEEQAIPEALPEEITQETPKETIPVGSKMKSFIPTLLGRFSKALPERKLYVKPPFGEDVENNENKKLTFSVGVILLIILVISIVFGIRQRGINQIKGKYEGKLTQASQNIDEAVSIYSTSPDRARELFASSEDLLSQVISLGVKDKRIDEVKSKIDSERGRILGEYQVTPDLFLDLTLLSADFNGDELSSSQGNLYVLDKSGKKVASVEISSKKSRVVAGPDQVDDPKGLASYTDRVFVINDGGVDEVGGESAKRVIDKNWNGEALIYAYTGNIYLLDKESGMIVRFPGSGEDFGEGADWLSSDTKVDFSGAKAWIIDGTVYVLSESGKISKFSQGSPQAFSIKGVYPSIANIDAIYTNEDNQNIYLLDSQGARVVVLDKKGNYIAQYASEEIKKAKGLMASEPDKKIIILTGDKLLSVEMKHL